MSNHERKENLPSILKGAETRFNDIAKRHGVPEFTFAREFEFAMLILKQNSYLADVAVGNPDSLKEAIIGVAAVGLSLSPVHKQAYLVPRKGRVCLDISYQGFVDLAVSKGAILWAKAELVKDRDQFELTGINSLPKHKIKKAFEDRGAVVGGYCVAKMPTGDLLVDHMSTAEIFAIRDRSEGYKAFKANTAKSTPWQTDESEMMKKTLIRRAYKSWPKTLAQEALNHAISAANDADGLVYESAQAPAEPDETDLKREAGITQIRNLIDILDRPESAFIEHVARSTNRKIGSLEDLTLLEIEQQIIFLEGIVNEKAEKLKKHKAGKDQSTNNPG